MNQESQRKAERSLFPTKRFLKPNGVYITQDLVYLKDLIKAGKICAVIDRTYPLVEVAAAHGYSETGVLWGKLRSRSPS